MPGSTEERNTWCDPMDPPALTVKFDAFVRQMPGVIAVADKRIATVNLRQVRR